MSNIRVISAKKDGFGRSHIIMTYNGTDKYAIDGTVATAFQLQTIFDWGNKPGLGRYLHRENIKPKRLMTDEERRELVREQEKNIEERKTNV